MKISLIVTLSIRNGQNETYDIWCILEGYIRLKRIAITFLLAKSPTLTAKKVGVFVAHVAVRPFLRRHIRAICTGLPYCVRLLSRGVASDVI